MGKNLRRAVILVATAVALTLSPATFVAPAVAGPVCPAGSNWDGRIQACR
ncbi:hypothetical protein Acy02nite_86100 [Actinoplanes cyaneus]|uniref:Uncharacterized protein n=1 Tax=Actinoplanes cyaneus TaxID=52696 RepID=A0A919MCJ3_9ACTN|nr:hypothetical protein [Actinoplanes cyaneus]MCW2144055.1 hypothetical protein [Actinoplanes cyaneus]GID70729.1 hypothetical protein Acy02nite_86100 [Actinoplanes cyaneus]